MSPLAPLIVSWIVGAALLPADGRKRSVAAVAVATMAAVAAMDLWFLGRMLAGVEPVFELVTGDWPFGIGIRLRIDGVSLLFAAVCAVSLSAVVAHETHARVESPRFPALLLLMCAGLHGAFFTGDLFNFYVFFELSVVTSFALAVYGYGRAESRAAFIYMIVNLLGSVLFLLGITTIYHAVGTLDYGAIAAAAADAGPDALIAGALLLTALALKLGLWPLHGWVPPVYTHVRPPIAAALAGALVNIGAYGLLRIGLTVFPAAADTARWLLLGLGAAATLYGALLALRRRVPAELAAYLAIANAGYVLLGLGIGGRLGVAAVLLVVIAGALDKTTMFLALDLRTRARGAVAFVAALGTAGLPLTLGFVAKVQLFRAGASDVSGSIAIGALVLATPLTIAAGIRFWRAVLGARPPAEPRTGFVVYALPALSVALGLAPEGVGELTARLGASLLEQGP